MDKKNLYVPHPLTHRDAKTIASYTSNLSKDFQTIQEYLSEVGDARWAASHLVRAIAEGLKSADSEASYKLREIANKLSTRQIDKPFKEEPKVAIKASTAEFLSLLIGLVPWGNAKRRSQACDDLANATNKIFNYKPVCGMNTSEECFHNQTRDVSVKPKGAR